MSHGGTIPKEERCNNVLRMLTSLSSWHLSVAQLRSSTEETWCQRWRLLFMHPKAGVLFHQRCSSCGQTDSKRKCYSVGIVLWDTCFVQSCLLLRYPLVWAGPRLCLLFPELCLVLPSFFPLSSSLVLLSFFASFLSFRCIFHYIFIFNFPIPFIKLIYLDLGSRCYSHSFHWLCILFPLVLLIITIDPQIGELFNVTLRMC